MDYIVTNKDNREVRKIFIPDDVYLIIKSYLFKTPKKFKMDKVIVQIDDIIKKTFVYKSLNLNHSERWVWDNWLLNKKIKCLHL